MVNELPKDWKRHHEFWSNEKSYKELDDILNKIANSIDKRRNHKDWEEAQDDIRYARGRWNRVKKDVRESRQRKSLNEGLTLSEDDFYGSRKDLLDAYLEWNGIMGYTQQIWDIIETGEAYFRDMDEDDLKDLKRRFGIYESKKKSIEKRLKESEVKRYSDSVPYEKRKYWYWTKHGLGPGTLPKGVNVLDAKEGQNNKGTWGVFVLLDAVLNTNELKNYDIIELAPDNAKRPIQVQIFDGKNDGKMVDFVESLNEDDDYEEDTPRCKRVERFLDRIDIFDLGYPLVRERDGVVEVEFPDVEVTEDDINKIKRNAREILGIDVDTDADGNYFTFYFALTESHKSRNKKLTEGKLVEPFQEDIEFFENYITDVIGYEIEAKGRTLMGNKHYQIRSLFQDADRSDLLELVKGLNKLDELMEKREIPMTYSAGIDDHGYVTAGLDLNKKYVPDETDEPLEHSRRYTKLFVDNTNESLVESRQLNEGAGAGYTISGNVGDVRINNITITEDETTDTTIYYGVEGDIELDLVDVRCESYYYGGTIPETTAKVEWLGLSAEKSWELPAPTEEDVFELLINMDFSTTYGGGWLHSSFGNDLEMSYNDINYSSATYDVDKLEIKFTDPKAVDAIDKYATGENYDVEFSVLDKDKYEVEYFDNLDDAIAYAKEENQPFVAETHWGWEYLGNDEYNTTDRVDSSEVVWKNEDLEVED